MSRDDSVISIGETMARDEYRRFASQRDGHRHPSNEEIIKKVSKKIYRASPSISREQSRVMEEVNNGPIGAESSKDNCNVVDESEIVENYIKKVKKVT